MSQFTFGHALCIGVGAYHDPSVTSVPITVREAEQVAAILQDPAIAAYPPSQVQLLTNAQATKQNIVAALEDLAQRTGTDDTVLIFFSGHGRMGDDGKYVLGVYDTVAASSEQFKAESGLSQDELFHLLRAITAQKLLLIVNACLAGSLSGSLGRSETPEWLGSPPPLPFVNQLLKSGEGRAMITASRPTQPSYFLRAQEYSYFGQALIEGLNGHGITPRGGAIVLLDLYDYIHRQVGAAVKKEAVARKPPVAPRANATQATVSQPAVVSGRRDSEHLSHFFSTH